MTTNQPFNEEWEKFVDKRYENTKEAEVSRYLIEARNHIEYVLYKENVDITDNTIYEKVAHAQVYIENALQILKENQ